MKSKLIILTLLASSVILQANANTLVDRIINAVVSTPSGPVIQRGPAPIKGDVWMNGAWYHCVQRSGETTPTCYRLVRQPPPPT